MMPLIKTKQEITEAHMLDRQDSVVSRELDTAVQGFVVASDRLGLQTTGRQVNKPYRCSVCGMDFAFDRVREAHEMLEHQVPAHWRCGVCGLRFIQGLMLRMHTMASHCLQSHLCTHTGCWAVFHCRKELASHCRHQHQMGQQEQQLHKVEQSAEQKVKQKAEQKLEQEAAQNEQKQQTGGQQLPSKGDRSLLYHCPHCPKVFPHQSKLTYHMRVHTGEKPFQCTLCPRAYRRSCDRTKHFCDFHQKVRSHLCNCCGKKFNSASILTRHLSCHTGEKPYACPYCPCTFSKSSARKVHMRQHTGEKPYVCEHCGQSFTVRVSLRTHLRSKHGVVVDTSMYRRKVEPGVDLNSLPSIGRPKKKQTSSKQLDVI